MTVSARPSIRRLALRVSLCLLGMLLTASAVHAEPVFSKSRRFRIPFEFDAGELRRLGTKEVQLFVSRDGGERWNQVDGVSPAESRFTFEAPEDGHYWFSVKTIASSGLIYPAGPHQPGLHVLVDSTPPQLELSLIEVEAGRVKLSWHADDSNLDLNSLSLEYRDSQSSVWNMVAVRTHQHGQTTWTVPQGGLVEVRGSVADQCGNITESSATCELAAPVPRNDRPDHGRPVANMPVDLTTTPAPAPARPASTPSRLTSATAGEPLAAKDAATSPSSPPASPLTHADGAPVHRVNFKTFRVGYSLDGVGPSGVRKVNLYITEDNGQKWYHYGEDEDKTSPIEVTVPGDGEYGLAFRVTNGLGRVDIPPQPHDLPEVRILVDCTPPQAQIQTVEFAGDSNTGKVLITWKAEDQDLGDRPISLHYSSGRSGPWTPIEQGITHTGQYLWGVPDTVDQPIFIRLDVRDAAGNVTQQTTERPFVIDRQRPRARVTEVAPLSSQR